MAVLLYVVLSLPLSSLSVSSLLVVAHHHPTVVVVGFTDRRGGRGGVEMSCVGGCNRVEGGCLLVSNWSLVAGENSRRRRSPVIFRRARWRTGLMLCVFCRR
ncbi:hypothetical protein HanIR_Chr16g0808571 [Helianthus annuus]|nr:hypothetical protein HanIR_Chr16g0808571 [Helianthus annuus]